MSEASKMRSWRERAHEDPLAQALIARGATDAEAADVFAQRCQELQRDLTHALEANPAPIVIRMPLERRWPARRRSDFARTAVVTIFYDDPGRANLTPAERDEYHLGMQRIVERVEFRRFVKLALRRGWPTWAHRATDPGAT